MSTSTSMNINIDPDVKQQFEDFCDNVGMSVSTAVNLFVHRVIKDNKLPFEIKGDMPNDETLEALEEVKRFEENPQNFTDSPCGVSTLNAMPITASILPNF